MKSCENCGEKVYDGACVNCHEEIYIEQQYHDLNMPVPESIEQTAAIQRKEIQSKEPGE